MKSMNPHETLREVTRRHFFQSTGVSLGSVALAALTDRNLLAAPPGRTDPLAPKQPHHPAKAKNVIYLFQAGAPSHLDLFDYKPKLVEMTGEFCPDSVLPKGERFAFIRTKPRLLGTPHKFERHGTCGMELSAALPHLGGVADDVCLIRSLKTPQFNHAPAQIMMNTGHQIPGRPSMGSWLTYGLGSENADLPGFVVLISGLNNPDGGKACWSSGFLPTTYQGIEFRSKGDPVLFVNNPDGVSPEIRRASLDALGDLNRARLADVNDPEIATRIAQYEMAFRMQTSVPELSDLSKETDDDLKLYGAERGKPSFAANCLLARRLVERGVRFVQLYHRGWDHHGASPGTGINDGLVKLCEETDQGSAALVTDLKRRGLLENTIVIWGGEFGRTPLNEERGGSKFLGRDHHPHSFGMWLAGGGFKPGYTHGKTDDFGYQVVEDLVEIHDLHATILHQLGVDHTKLTYRFQGRDFRLTDVFGEVKQKLLA